MANFTVLCSLFLILFWAVHDTSCTDPCSANAVLKFYNSIYLTTETRQSILFDYTDFLAVLDKIQLSVEPFIKEISDYSTMEQLDELAVVDLMPFNNRVNLVPVSNQTVAKLFETCNSLGTTAFGFEDKTEMALMEELMAKKKLDKIIFVCFIVNSGILSFGGQKFLHKIPAEWSATEVAAAKALWFKSDGTLALDNTATAIGYGFCQLPASPFQSVKFEAFEGRSWLELVSRSIDVLNDFDKLYNNVKKDLRTVRTKAYTEEAVVNTVKFTWTTPAEFIRAHEFISHYDYDKMWDQAVGSILYELSNFVQDIELINNVLRDEIIVSQRRLAIVSKKIVSSGFLATRIDLTERLTGEKGNGLFLGEGIGKSIDEAAKVSIYRGYAHVVTPYKKASDAFVMISGSTYRAVDEYEEFNFDCVGTNGKQYCSQHSGGQQKAEYKCGNFFMGISDDPSNCRMEDVSEPVAYNAYCSEKGEVISSYSEPYKMSIWCNGHMSEMLSLDAGVSEIRSECEVRSEDGKTQYSTQYGRVESKEVDVVKSRQGGVGKILENLKKIGEPVYGTIFGLSLSLFLAIAVFILKCIGFRKCVNILKCNRQHVIDPDTPMEELEPFRRQARFAPVQVFNVNPGNMGGIVPRSGRRNPYAESGM